jgi:UDP-N-acetylglucosamine 4,6-dehydratase
LNAVGAKSIDLEGKSVLVTGGTGSFGKTFVRHVLKNVRSIRVVIFSRDEQKQYEFANSLAPDEHANARFFLGDVRDASRLSMAMRNVDYVVHAAALKIVPTAEYNPFECIQTNVVGAENVVRAAIEQKVKRVIALSTDKACNPINLYGASKLASDKIFVAANHLAGADGPRFSVVRYGNVIGSRGSVLPFFRDLIAKGAQDLPITDPRMTRFWIAVEQGVEFVLSCLAISRGGEIFVPKIPSMRLVDLAHALAPGLAHRIVGIRPGEKLHEVMISRDDARNTVDLGDRYVIEPATHLWDKQRRSFIADGGKQVAEGFEYASDTNEAWLSAKELNALAAGNSA